MKKKSLTALLLDDDTTHAYLLARILEDVEDLDVDLIHYTTSERAMCDLLSEKADLVFLDHYLGEGKTGLDLLRSMREHGFDGSIVMLTGSEEDDLVASFQRFGADAYVSKSELDPARLGAAIEVALRCPHRDVPRLLRQSERPGRRTG